MPQLRDYFAEIYMSASFVGAGIMSNVAQKYPPLARLPSLACAGVIGYFVGYVGKQWFIRRRVNQDLAVWDYVARHPEDFPELEKPKKYKDVLLEWTPIR